MQRVSPSRRREEPRRSGLLGLPGRLWRGEVPLHDVFWNWAIIGGLAVNGLTTAGMFILLAMERPVAALVIGYVCSVPYNFFIAVAVWRSADRHPGSRRAANIMRYTAAIMLFLISFT